MHTDDTYYLKALDNYPYNLEEVIESLKYGLSSNPEHAGLLTLQGKLYANELQQPELAIETFSTVIVNDPSFKQAYYELGLLLLNQRKMKRADKLIQLALQQFGSDQAKFIYLKAYQAEIEKQYDKAIELLELAKMNCYNESSQEFYDNEIQRINKKNIKPMTIGRFKILYELK